MARNPEDITRAEEVANAFVRLYYDNLTSNKELLLSRYDDDSFYSHGEAAREPEERRSNQLLVGPKAIDEKIRKVAEELGDFKVRVCQVDSQPCVDQSILAVASGYILTPSGATARRFHHTFVLVPIPGAEDQYCIRNDCCRFFPLEDIVVVQQAPAVVEPARKPASPKHTTTQTHHAPIPNGTADAHPDREESGETTPSPNTQQETEAPAATTERKGKGKGKKQKEERAPATQPPAAEVAAPAPPAVEPEPVVVEPTPKPTPARHEEPAHPAPAAKKEAPQHQQKQEAPVAPLIPAAKATSGVKSFKDALSKTEAHAAPVYKVPAADKEKAPVVVSAGGRPATPPPAHVHCFVLKGIPSKATEEDVRDVVTKHYGNPRIVSVRNKADKGIAFVDLEVDVLAAGFGPKDENGNAGYCTLGTSTRVRLEVANSPAPPSASTSKAPQTTNRGRDAKPKK